VSLEQSLGEVFLNLVVCERSLHANYARDSYENITKMHADYARDSFENITKIAPDFLPAYTESAKLDLELGNIQAAKKWLDKAERIQPGHEFTRWVRKGIAEAQEKIEARYQGEIDTARDKAEWTTMAQLAEACIASCGETSMTLRQQGFIYWALEDWNRSIAAFDRFMAQEGLRCDALALRALSRLESGDRALAFRDLYWGSALVAMFGLPEDYDPTYQGQFIPYAQRPEVAVLYAVRAVDHCWIGDLERAEQDSSFAVAELPHLGFIHLLRAEVLACQKKRTEAEIEIRLALQDPQLPPEKRKRAEAYLAGGHTLFFLRAIHEPGIVAKSEYSIEHPNLPRSPSVAMPTSDKKLST
jgi:tetratricopeptide (TPR) repeat protein